jgi:hypothetical protein
MPDHKLLRRFVLVVAVCMLTALVGVPRASATIADKRNDYNRDGVSDLLALGSNHCLYRWSGDGTGRLGTAVQLGCGWDRYRNTDLPGLKPALTAVGDITGDGVGDLVGINTETHCLWRWSGNGRGGLNGGVEVGCGWEPYEHALGGAGDLNNDGYGDLVAIHTIQGCLYRWYGNGTGGFSHAVRIGCESWRQYAPLPTVASPGILGAGDLTGDGNADLVAIDNLDHCITRWNGTGSSIVGGTVMGCNWYNIVELSGMGDMNRDGHGDLLGISTTDDCLYRWSGNGTGGLRTAVRVGCGWQYYDLIP